MNEMLSGKRILIVDDEPDILESLKGLLDVCIIDSAPNLQTAYCLQPCWLHFR